MIELVVPGLARAHPTTESPLGVVLATQALVAVGATARLAREMALQRSSQGAVSHSVLIVSDLAIARLVHAHRHLDPRV